MHLNEDEVLFFFLHIQSTQFFFTYKIYIFFYTLYFTAYTKAMLTMLLIYNILYCFNYQFLLIFFSTHFNNFLYFPTRIKQL